MECLETERLRLRPFEEGDYPLILAIASDPETVKYLCRWGLPGVPPQQDARRFLDSALAGWAQNPIRVREYCLVRKDTGEAIGDGSIEYWNEDTAEIGWILLPAHRGQGYVTEMGRALLRYGFEKMGVQRIIAHCDALNAPSYHVMERLGMRREGVAWVARPAKTPGGQKGDECTYAILREDWEKELEIAEYEKLPCHFEGFISVPELTDGEIRLICVEKKPANPEKKYVPAYSFLVARAGEKIGEIDLRIGYPPALYYAGQIGYSIGEAYRGHGYAAAACRLLAPVMRAHGMHTALITNDVNNVASRRVCQKLRARFLRRARLPENHELRRDGQEWVNVFAWEIGE